MRVLLLLAIAFCQMVLAYPAINKKCEQVLPAVSGLTTNYLKEAYTFKSHNNNSWHKTGKIGDTYYNLRPKEVVKYKFSWAIISSLDDNKNLAPGEFTCEAVTSWQLVLNSAVNVIYPQAVHNNKQEDSIYQIETFAGIYLAKSKYDYFPNTVGLIWHLVQKEIPDFIEQRILDNFKFVSRDMLTITKIENFEKSGYVQLVALRFSNQKDIEQGNQLWLISNEVDHQSFNTAGHSVVGSSQKAWLPWFNANNPEFFAKTPIDVYKNTIVRPVGRLIFDRKNKIFIPEQPSIDKIAQASYDVIYPPVRNFLERQGPLFGFLLFKHNYHYQLMRFEIAQDGRIENKFTFVLADPWQIGLPSAQELGFSSNLSE